MLITSYLSSNAHINLKVEMKMALKLKTFVAKEKRQSKLVLIKRFYYAQHLLKLLINVFGFFYLRFRNKFYNFSFHLLLCFIIWLCFSLPFLLTCQEEKNSRDGSYEYHWLCTLSLVLRPKYSSTDVIKSCDIFF